MLCVPGRHTFLCENLALEFVHILLGLVNMLVVGDRFQIKLKILLFACCAFGLIPCLLTIQTLLHVLLLLLVFVLGCLPPSSAFQIPHVGIVILNSFQLFFIKFLFPINLSGPILALVLLNQMFALDSLSQLLLIVGLTFLELLLALEHLVFPLHVILIANLLTQGLLIAHQIRVP